MTEATQHMKRNYLIITGAVILVLALGTFLASAAFAQDTPWGGMMGRMLGDSQTHSAMQARMQAAGMGPGMMGRMFNTDGTPDIEAMQEMHNRMHPGEPMPAGCTEMMADPEHQALMQQHMANPGMMQHMSQMMQSGTMDPEACTEFMAENPGMGDPTLHVQCQAAMQGQ